MECASATIRKLFSYQKVISRVENYHRIFLWLKSCRGKEAMMKQLMRIRSAFLIGRWWRRAVARKKYLKFKNLVTKVQATFRARVAARNYRSIKKSAVGIQRWFRRNQNRKRKHANSLSEQVHEKERDEVLQDELKRCAATERNDFSVHTIAASPFGNSSTKVPVEDTEAISSDEEPLFDTETIGDEVRKSSNVPQISPEEIILSTVAIPSEYARQNVSACDEICADGMVSRCLYEEKKVIGPPTFQKILTMCCQTEVLDFDAVLPSSDHKRWKKLGEGNYGEVFGWRSACGNLSRVFKLIPVEGRHPGNDLPQDTINDVLPEMIATWKLSELSEPGSPTFTKGFVKLNGLRYVKGKYPQIFVDCSKVRNRKRDETMSYEHEKYDTSQKYIIIDTEYVGRPLALMKSLTPLQASSIFQQVACSLAAAEEIYRFEHRDLHPGNILISSTNEALLEFKICGETIRVNTYDLRATIIDYSLSRLECDGIVYFRDLCDHEFSGYDGTYSAMREYNRNRWDEYCPRTNVFWLHKLWTHIYSKMLKVWFDHNREFTAKFQFCCVASEILDYRSATAVATKYLSLFTNLHNFTPERLQIVNQQISRPCLLSLKEEEAEDDE